jgi:hypothetical protein
VGVDTTRASIARVHDYSLGGKDNYAVDRAAYARVLEVAPHQGDVSVMNRRWLHRVVRYMAGRAGVDQFLDIGAGLPTAPPPVHEVAQSENRGATVVYVDNDPVCNAHGRVLLEQNEDTHFISADFLEAGTLFENKDVRRYLELSRPVGVIVSGLLSHVDDALDPAAVMREYAARMPPGSYLAISHAYDPGDEDTAGHDLARSMERAFVDGGLGSGWFRTREQIGEFFGGLELIEPGLVPLNDWWPSGPVFRDPHPEECLVLGGVAVKADPAHEPVRLRGV